MRFTSLFIRSQLVLSCLGFSFFWPGHGHAEQSLDKLIQTPIHQCGLGASETPRRIIKTPSFAMRNLHVAESGAFTKFLTGFGGLGFFSNAINITGSVDLPEPVLVNEVEEDNGSIPLAANLNLQAGSAVRVESLLGDGPFADTPGKTDVDFYALRNLEQGQTLRIRASELQYSPGQEIPDLGRRGYNIAIYDDSGRPISGRPVLFGADFVDISFSVPSDGDYFIGLVGVSATEISDVFDSTSVFFLDSSFLPIEDPVRNRGAYTLDISLDYGLLQTFRFFAKPGVVLSAALQAPTGSELIIVDPENVARLGSAGTLSLRSEKAPFAQGNVEVAHVSDKLGIYEIQLLARAPGDYELTLRADLPPLSKPQRNISTQVIYIDFEPATVAENTFFLTAGNHPAFNVSGLSDNMDELGLTTADEDQLIDQIVETVNLQLLEQLQHSGASEAYDIDIRNSRDHENVWGEENVSRVVIAGIREETFDLTEAAGLAQSLDVGNFDTEETAYVNLEAIVLNNSEVPATRFGLPIEPDFGDVDPLATRVRFYGNAIATLISHEVGHILGNYHVFSPEDIMLGDTSVVNTRRIDFGPDGIAGTDDDVLPTFGQSFIDSPPLYGFQNTVSNIVFGNASPIRRRGSFSSSFSSKSTGEDVSIEYLRKENGEEVESFNFAAE